MKPPTSCFPQWMHLQSKLSAEPHRSKDNVNEVNSSFQIIYFLQAQIQFNLWFENKLHKNVNSLSLLYILI